MKIYKKITTFLSLIYALALPSLVLAANPVLEKLNNVATEKGPYQKEMLLSDMIGLVISVGLSIIGIVFLGLMLYAGYNWMTARGEEDKVSEAKDTITRAVIGIIIVVGSYALWKFVFSRLF